MNPLTFLAQPAWRHLVLALLHTLWQGAVLAILLVLALRMVSVRRPLTRYALSMAAQFGVLLAGLATWAVLEHQPSQPQPQLTQPAPLETISASPSLVPSIPVVRVGSSETLAPGPLGWVPAAALVWVAGVTLMLIRTTGSALAAVRLTRGPRVRDRVLLDLVEGLCRDLGIRCQIRVVSCRADLGPCVIGAFWPTIVLPVAFVTGLPADELRAILTHELAHIRRRDYLWNLTQMLVESLLFFNPVVWWLGRQVRIEREACCDATAVALTGRPLDYSQTLAAWAERARSTTMSPTLTAAAISWGGPRHPSPLRERILRILRPGERPRPRISWGGMLGLLLIGPIILFGLHRGTLVAVEFAAQILAPAERLEQLKVAQAEYAPLDVVQEPTEEDQSKSKVTLKGTIRTPDGRALPKPIPASIITRTKMLGTMGAVGPLNETFSIECGDGSTYLYVEPADYAPTFVGPFVTRRGQTVEGIEISLEPGFPTRIHVVDERGAPVAGVRIKGGLIMDGGTCFSSLGWLTDDKGVATILHASGRTYRMTIDAPGFQPFSTDAVTLKPDSETRLMTTHARPTRGVIVTHTGEPLAGARIKPLYESGPSGLKGSGGFEPPLATTDSAGQFTLDRLVDETTYAFLIETDGHGRCVVAGVEPGQSGLRWSVDRERIITGTIKGDLATLTQDGGKPIIWANQTVAVSDLRHPRSGQGLSWKVPVDPTEGGGSFRVTGLLPGEVTLMSGNQTRRLVVGAQEDAVMIDMTQPVEPSQRRRVVLRILTPDGSVQPSGSVHITTTTRPAGLPATSSSFSQSLPIKEGKVEFDAPVPGSVAYDSQTVVGYWFPSGNIEVEPGVEPKTVEVQGVPAGAIVGQVFDSDGQPLTKRVDVQYAPVEKLDAFKEVYLVSFQSDEAIQGRFFLSPLPIGGTYVVVATHGHNKQVSRPIKLDGAKATERVDIRMAKPATASGRVFGPDGRPLRGMPVSLSLRHPQAETSWGQPILTDGDGRFQFDDVSSELSPYLAVLDFRKDYQPAEVKLNPGGAPVEIRLEPGHVVAGRILDAATGWPIPGVELYAHLPEWRNDERYHYEAEGRTDEEGRFRFSNLPNRPLNLNDRSGLRWQSPSGSRTIEPGNGRVFEIRAKLPAWSRLKPAKPAGK